MISNHEKHPVHNQGKLF